MLGVCNLRLCACPSATPPCRPGTPATLTSTLLPCHTHLNPAPPHLGDPVPQSVRFQNKAGRVLNRGLLNERGTITCYCKQCSGGVAGAGRDVSASEFEEHSGSKDRRPADGIFMEGEGGRGLVCLRAWGGSEGRLECSVA